MVFDMVKKALFTGVGLASMTKEKIDELGRDLSRHADLSEAEAAKFQEELERRAKSAQEDLRAEIDSRVESATKQLGLARADEVAGLTAKVAALTARIERLEAQAAGSGAAAPTDAGPSI